MQQLVAALTASVCPGRPPPLRRTALSVLCFQCGPHRPVTEHSGHSEPAIAFPNRNCPCLRQTHHQPLKAQVSPDLDLEPDLPWPFFSPSLPATVLGLMLPFAFSFLFEMGPLAEVCATYIDESMQAGRLTSSAVWTRWQTPTFDMCICHALIAVSTGTYQFTIHRRANPKFIHHGSGYLDRSCSGVDVGSSIRLFQCQSRDCVHSGETWPAPAPCSAPQTLQITKEPGERAIVAVSALGWNWDFFVVCLLVGMGMVLALA